jgi:hypothetical protein
MVVVIQNGFWLYRMNYKEQLTHQFGKQTIPKEQLTHQFGKQTIPKEQLTHQFGKQTIPKEQLTHQFGKQTIPKEQLTHQSASKLSRKNSSLTNRQANYPERITFLLFHGKNTIPININDNNFL